MAYTHFKDNFWNSDPTGTVGYDVIIQHLNDGRRTCKEVEEFMKASTLKRSLDMFKLQIEHVGQTHLQLAQNMRDEAKKLEDFRERQKDAKKKVEFQMDSLHKQKVLQFRRTLESKKAYEQKCRDKEEADQNVNRNANNTRNIEKVPVNPAWSSIGNVTSLAKIRNEWLNEHGNACEVFEAQAKERINTLRNTVWTHVNQLSQQCVTSDELYEEVRKSLDQCDIKEDIEYFIHLRRTGDKPPAPVLYENFYSSDRNPNAGQFSKSPLPINR
uniref:Proline-serine-threonine phosphatase interacting protein 2 n=1 Tax=Gadus morhua TaxID=8049 RepID=A0A8C4ZXE5_GADMO